MKPIIILLLMSGVRMSVCAQDGNVAKSEISYNISLKDLWNKGDDYIDTVKLSAEKFKIKYDDAGVNKGVELVSVKLEYAGTKKDVTATFKTNEFTVGKDTAFSFTFRMAKIPKDSNSMKAPSTIRDVKVVFSRTSSSSSKTEMEKKVEEIGSKLDEIFKEKGTRKAIGYFILKTDKVLLKSSCDKQQKFAIDSIPIKRVEINVANGYILRKGLSVELSNGEVFRNDKAPISIYKFSDRTTDNITIQDSRDGICKSFQLGAVLAYNYSGKFHYPDDDSASLTPERRADSLYNFSAINDLIDVNIYTDMLGLIGRKPNGILQTLISGNFIVNTTNFKNCDVTPLSFLKPYFRLSKFDSRFSQLDSNVVKDGILTNRLYLNQISYLQAGIKLNLLRIGLGPNQQLLLNIGGDVNLTSADSLLRKDVTSAHYYPEIEYRINGLENFGMEASTKWMYQKISNNSSLKNTNGFWVFNPQVTIYYYPFDNPGNKIYIRYSNFAEIGGGVNNFGQFQFGFKTNLFKKEAK